MLAENLDRSIDRLVDCELSDNELKSLLRTCDNNPSHWRKMALAFVESQVMSSELTAIHQESDRESLAVKRVGWLPNRAADWLTLVMAASIAIAIGFGFGKSSVPGSGGLDNGFENRVVDFNPHGADRKNESLGDDSFQILVSNPDGSLREIEVPLVDDIKDFRERSGYPKDLVEQFRRQGHQVDYERQFVPVILRDGRDAIVPIDSMRFRSKRYQ